MPNALRSEAPNTSNTYISEAQRVTNILMSVLDEMDQGHSLCSTHQIHWQIGNPDTRHQGHFRLQKLSDQRHLTHHLFNT